ncbi:MAG: Na+/H+ antiporter NhaA [Rhodoglobus sp.]
MSVLRSERFSAVLLLVAALIGVVLANSPYADVAAGVVDFPLGLPIIGLELSISHWVKDGLLAVFFFIAAIELRHELRHGELDSAAKALVPTVAAVGGVIVPAAIFLLLVRDEQLSQGWPIPTATDIAFALGVLAIVGRSLPAKIRTLLLALAVIDDLIAIVIIATFFTTDLQPLPLLCAVPVILLFGWCSHRLSGQKQGWVVAALTVLGLTAWALIYQSGVHPTIAGVALGLIMADAPAERTRHVIEPWSNVVILPTFACVAALVPIPVAQVSELSTPFWAVIIALPLGKLLGITAGAVIAARLSAKNHADATMPLGDVLAVAGLGGIGFTVSLLMNELAYENQESTANEVTLAVLIASVLAALLGGTLAAVRNRHYALMVGGGRSSAAYSGP